METQQIVMEWLGYENSPYYNVKRVEQVVLTCVVRRLVYWFTPS